MKIIKNLSDSIESKFSNLARKKNFKKQKIYSLGLGEPYFQTPKNISKSCFKSILDGNTRYSISNGTINLRTKISKKINNRLNIFSDYKNILITPGSKFSLYLILKSILQPKDTIINFKPCYPSYDPQILLAEPNARIISFNLDKRFNINFDRFSNLFIKRIKAVLINSPNNPTGKIFSKKELLQILNLVRKENAWIIFDSIYEDLNYLNYKFELPKELINYKKFIYISGFSKSYSMTGWRLGYIFTKNKIIEYMNKINQHLITNVPVFIQDAGLEALRNNNKDIRRFNLTLKKNFNHLNTQLKQYNFLLPDLIGGMFVFIDISRFRIKSDEFCEKLLNTYKVACTPGIFFGKKWDYHIRISLSSDHKIFVLSIKKLFKFMDNLQIN